MAASEQLTGSGGFSLETELLETLPILEHYGRHLGLWARLERAVGAGYGRNRLSPAKALRVVTMNICVHHEPVYALGEWVAHRDPATLGLTGTDVTYLNDDRVGRALGRLFDADRASLLGELVLHAIDEFGVDCAQLHNDSTSVRLSGVCAPTGRRRGRQKTIVTPTGSPRSTAPTC